MPIFISNVYSTNFNDKFEGSCQGGYNVGGGAQQNNNHYLKYGLVSCAKKSCNSQKLAVKAGLHNCKYFKFSENANKMVVFSCNIQ